ncbi:MAG: MFS transporter [Actinomycetota bacterium]|nr:MFS transporter [Actinomycetota bacterium]
MSTPTRESQGSVPLDWAQRRFLLVLALPAFGLSLAYTLTTTYVPVLLEALSGPVVTGAMVGGEGLLAIFLPLLIGSWSDRLNVRLPFLLVGALLAVAALVLLPIRPGSLAWVGICLGFFFVAYFVYSVPYYALYPDLVPREMMGRSQGVQGTFRAAALLLALSARRPAARSLAAAAVRDRSGCHRGGDGGPDRAGAAASGPGRVAPRP